MPKPKNHQDGQRFVEMVADRQGWVLNRDAEFIGHIVDGLVKNYNRYGFFQCPCRDGGGDRHADKDICCPCAYNLPDQAQYGHCFCGLFLSQQFAALRQQPSSIPERRPPELTNW